MPSLPVVVIAVFVTIVVFFMKIVPQTLSF
jgi:hypothetical protein